MSTISEITTQMVTAIDWHAAHLHFFHHATIGREIIAQAIENNLGDNVQSAWNNFVETGQIWAMGLGILLGYWFRSMSVG
ncbi:MAG: hypothetical protein SWY16_11215 [Cyanobacteriota bacterium]|nr:hypothetical protein [Cyanobacteriota bacterium]